MASPPAGRGRAARCGRTQHRTSHRQPGRSTAGGPHCEPGTRRSRCGIGSPARCSTTRLFGPAPCAGFAGYLRRGSHADLRPVRLRHRRQPGC